MKSTRCHKHKSYYTINIRDITRPNSYNESTIRVECNEETLKIQIWDDDHHVFVTRAVNVVNCFEHPEIVWDCMKGVLQMLPIDILAVDSEMWTATATKQQQLER